MALLETAVLAAGGMSLLGSVISGFGQAKAAKEAAAAAREEAKRRERLGREGEGIIKGGLSAQLARTGRARGDIQQQGSLAEGHIGAGFDRLQDFGTGELTDMFAQERGVGSQALERLQAILLGGDMSQFQMDPGFQFRQAEGEKGIARAAAAAGSFGSGGNLKDFARFNQGLASEEFGRSIQRLAGLQEIGSRATQNLAGLRTGLTQQQASLLGQAANLRQGMGQGLASLSQNEAQMIAQHGRDRANVLQGIAADPTNLQAINLEAQAAAAPFVSAGNSLQAFAPLAAFGAFNGGGGGGGGAGPSGASPFRSTSVTTSVPSFG